MGHYPASTVTANIKDHYTSFAPMLKNAGCIWDHEHKDYIKENSRKVAYQHIEKTLKWEGKTVKYCSCHFLAFCS